MVLFFLKSQPKVKKVRLKKSSLEVKYSAAIIGIRKEWIFIEKTFALTHMQREK
jgi:hypothetical protein